MGERRRSSTAATTTTTLVVRVLWLVAAALGSNLVVGVAVAEAAVVEVAVAEAEAGSTVFVWEPRDEEAMMFSRLLERT